MTTSQTHFDTNITQSLIKNYGKTLSCHEANKACYPACHRSCLTDAVCYLLGPALISLPLGCKEPNLPWEDQYCIISPTNVVSVVASELSFLCYKPSVQRVRTGKRWRRGHPRRRMLSERRALGKCQRARKYKMCFKILPRTCLWLELNVPNPGGPSSIPGEGTGSRMLQLKEFSCCN